MEFFPTRKSNDSMDEYLRRNPQPEMKLGAIVPPSVMGIGRGGIAAEEVAVGRAARQRVTAPTVQRQAPPTVQRQPPPQAPSPRPIERPVVQHSTPRDIETSTYNPQGPRSGRQTVQHASFEPFQRVQHATPPPIQRQTVSHATPRTARADMPQPQQQLQLPAPKPSRLNFSQREAGIAGELGAEPEPLGQPGAGAAQPRRFSFGRVAKYAAPLLAVAGSLYHEQNKGEKAAPAGGAQRADAATPGQFPATFLHQSSMLKEPTAAPRQGIAATAPAGPQNPQPGTAAYGQWQANRANFAADDAGQFPEPVARATQRNTTQRNTATRPRTGRGGGDLETTLAIGNAIINQQLPDSLTKEPQLDLSRAAGVVGRENALPAERVREPQVAAERGIAATQPQQAAPEYGGVVSDSKGDQGITFEEGGVRRVKSLTPITADAARAWTQQNQEPYDERDAQENPIKIYRGGSPERKELTERTVDPKTGQVTGERYQIIPATEAEGWVPIGQPTRAQRSIDADIEQKQADAAYKREKNATDIAVEERRATSQEYAADQLLKGHQITAAANVEGHRISAGATIKAAQIGLEGEKYKADHPNGREGAGSEVKDMKELVKTYYGDIKGLNLPEEYTGQHMKLAKLRALTDDPKSGLGLYYNPGTPGRGGIITRKDIFEPLMKEYTDKGYPAKDAMANALRDLQNAAAGGQAPLYVDYPNLDRLPNTLHKVPKQEDKPLGE